jgi:hypothetical protein
MGSFFYGKVFFLEKHIGSSFDVELSPRVMFEYCSMPLLKSSQMGFEFYPTALLCAFIKVLPPLVREKSASDQISFNGCNSKGSIAMKMANRQYMKFSWRRYGLKVSDFC